MILYILYSIQSYFNIMTTLMGHCGNCMMKKLCKKHFFLDNGISVMLFQITFPEQISLCTQVPELNATARDLHFVGGFLLHGPLLCPSVGVNHELIMRNWMIPCHGPANAFNYTLG